MGVSPALNDPRKLQSGRNTLVCSAPNLQVLYVYSPSFLVCYVFIATNAHALSGNDIKDMVFGETEARVEALNKAAINADEKTAAFILALADDPVKTSGDKVFIVRDDKAFDPLTGVSQPVPADAEDVIKPNLMRSELDNAIAALKLLSKDEKIRAAAIKTLAGESDEARLPLIEKAFAAETVPGLKSQLELMRAAILLSSSDRAKRSTRRQCIPPATTPTPKPC